jgi:hypothetical protein
MAWVKITRADHASFLCHLGGFFPD